MESDDDFDSFSLHNNEPSPSLKHRRLKRLKKSSEIVVESVSQIIDSPKADLARLETLESSDIRVFNDSGELRSGFDDENDGKVKELNSCYDDTRVNIDRNESQRELALEEKLSSGVGDMPVTIVQNENKRSLGFDDDDDVSLMNSDREETNGDVELENNMTSGFSDMPVRSDRKEAKRALEFDDEIQQSEVDQTPGKEAETKIIEIGETEEKDVNADKKGKKRRLKSSSDDSKSKTSVSNKRRQEKVYLFACVFKL